MKKRLNCSIAGYLSSRLILQVGYRQQTLQSTSNTNACTYTQDEVASLGRHIVVCSGKSTAEAKKDDMGKQITNINYPG